MMRSIIHAGGESTRLREIFDGPKALAPVGKHTLLWFHLQPLIRSNLLKEYTFTLRNKCEVVKEHIIQLGIEFGISVSTVIEPKPLGRAGSLRLGIEEGIIDTNETYLMSNPDDLVPVDLGQLTEYASKAESNGKSIIMIMAKRVATPFGIGVARKTGEVNELEDFKEKPELALQENYYANTGMILFLPDAMKEFRSVPLDRPTHPEEEIIPRLTNQNKVAVFAVERWLPINYAADYKKVVEMGSKELLVFLNS